MAPQNQNPFQPTNNGIPSPDIPTQPQNPNNVVQPNLVVPVVQPQVYGPTEAITPENVTSIQPASANSSDGFEMPTAPAVLPPSNQDFQSYSQQQSKSTGGKSKKKLILMVGLPALLLLGGTSAAYFGYYVPNKPENVWTTALERSGEAYDEMVNFVDTTSKKENVELEGDFKISGALAADGGMKGGSGKNGSILAGDISAVGLKVNYEVRSINSARSTPDIYFKVSGLEGIGDLVGLSDPVYTKAINSINNQWYVIDHSLFDQIAGSTNSDVQFSMGDVNELLKVVGESSKIYVFTKDTTKTVLINQKSVGKETQDGRKVYHYKVGVNKENLKKYNNDLCDRLSKTKIFKLFGEGGVDGYLADCKDVSDIDELDSKSTADVWVDAKTKLIHKVRFSEKGDNASYLDISQDYTGGDEIPLGITLSSKDSTTTLKVILNRSTNVISLKATSKATGEGAYNANLNLTLKPTNTEVKVEAPEGAKNIITLLNDLGFGDILTSTTSGVGQKSNDTERKTDINAITSHLEAYNAQYGYYPTLAEVNNETWRAKNFLTFDDEALKDPDGTVYQLSGSPEVTTYMYQSSPAGCGGVDANACTSYTLSALLSDGTEYTKESLN